MLLKDKVLLVTGASAGIGRAVAIEAARQGADVAINYFDPTDEAAKSAVKEIEALGRRAIAIKGDVAAPDCRARLYRRGGGRAGQGGCVRLQCRHMPVPCLSSTCRAKPSSAPSRSTCTAPIS